MSVFITFNATLGVIGFEKYRVASVKENCKLQMAEWMAFSLV